MHPVWTAARHLTLLLHIGHHESYGLGRRLSQLPMVSIAWLRVTSLAGMLTYASFHATGLQYRELFYSCQRASAHSALVTSQVLSPYGWPIVIWKHHVQLFVDGWVTRLPLAQSFLWYDAGGTCTAGPWHWFQLDRIRVDLTDILNALGNRIFLIKLIRLHIWKPGWFCISLWSDDRALSTPGIASIRGALATVISVLWIFDRVKHVWPF